jgi:hypothetical protein
VDAEPRRKIMNLKAKQWPCPIPSLLKARPQNQKRREEKKRIEF